MIYLENNSNTRKKSVNGTTYRKDDKAVPHDFNTFFSSIGQKTAEQIKMLRLRPELFLQTGKWLRLDQF